MSSFRGELTIQEIDEQHHKFIDLIAKLETAVAENSVKEHLNEVYDGLRDYVAYHFTTEEHHFDEFGCYPNAEAHKAAHRAFTEHITDIRYRFLDNEEVLTVELAHAMYDWLVNHIKHMDREYIECFKSKGL
ncbi:MAG: bacteriohemerythrin [Patescibacteria group bacterium]